MIGRYIRPIVNGVKVWTNALVIDNACFKMCRCDISELAVL